MKTSFGKPIDLPQYKEGTYYIVSVLTAQAARDSNRATDDLLITSEPVRDNNGKIIGCKRFAIL